MASIQGLDKAAVLAALYNASKPQGMGFMHYEPQPMTVEEARQLLKSGQTYFDYVKGRVMKIDLKKDDEVDTWGYNRDNGADAAEKVIETLRHTSDTNAKPIQETHANGTLAATAAVEDCLDEPTTIKGGVMNLGLSDVKHALGPAVAKVTRGRN